MTNWLVKYNDGLERVVAATDIRMAERFAQSFYGHTGRRLIVIAERPDLPASADDELLGKKAHR